MFWSVALLAPVFTGIWAVLLGQDTSWDVRNYHFYNPYAFLTGRIGYDIAPGQVASFYNPLLHVPFYLLVTHVSPRTVGFVLGAVQGLNVALLFLIARHCIAAVQTPRGQWIALGTALVAITGAGFRSELGTTFADNVVSLLTLASLWVVVSSIDVLRAGAWRKAVPIAVVAGVLGGLAAGLKQPSVVYAVGLCLGFFALDARFQRQLALAFVFGLGVLMGIAAGGGYWMVELWERYGNPLFPYFNQIFHSPWGTAADYRDTRYVPGSLWWALIFPLNFVWRPMATAEVPFFDARLLILALALLGYGATLWLRRGAPRQAAAASVVAGRYLIVMLLGSYVVWLKMFGIYRYLVVVELLAPLALWWLFERWLRDARAVLGAGLVCAWLLVVTTRAGDWGRVPWGDDYFGVPVPTLDAPDNTLVLMSGYDPMAYLIPFFPPGVRFLRVHSYFTGPSATPNETDRLMGRIIAGHTGEIYAVYRAGDDDTAKDVLAAYGLGYDPSRCSPLRTRIELKEPKPLLWCPVTRNQPQ